MATAFYGSNGEYRDYIKQPLQVFSFGGGVQSTAIFCLILEGRLPRPDIIIHADTGSEMPYTLTHIQKIKALCLEHGLLFEVVKSPKGALHEVYAANNSLPILGFRSCTGVFKVDVINRRLREIVGMGRRRVLAVSWIGISADEARRRREARGQWLRLKYPLLDDVPMTRRQCVSLIEKHDLITQKSGCWLCPYGGLKHFKKLKVEHPHLFKICLDMEAAYFKNRPQRKTGLLQGVRLDSLNMASLEEYGFNFKGSQCEEIEGGCFL